MWIGACKGRTDTVECIKWCNYIKILGLIFSNQETASCVMENWETRINSIERVIALWSKRNLSIQGKVVVQYLASFQNKSYVISAERP